MVHAAAINVGRKLKEKIENVVLRSLEDLSRFHRGITQTTKTVHDLLTVDSLWLT